MIRLGPVTRLLALPALKRLILILSMIVAIFVAESFTALLEQALRHDGGSLLVAWLLLLQAPEIVDLALAIGMLVAVFFAVNDARNRGELIVLATNGVRWTRVLGFAVCMGALGAVMSVAVAGYVIPKARYAERVTKSTMRADHILKQMTEARPQNTRQTIRGTTFIASPPADNSQERGFLFVYQPGPDGSWQVGQSRDWTVEGPNDETKHEIILKNLKAYSGTFFASRPVPVNAFNVEQGGMGFHMSEVTGPTDLTHRAKERSLLPSTATPERLSSVGSRALLVPTAALLALAAVLLSGGGMMRYFSLPLAAVVLLAYDVLGKTLIADASQVFHPFWVILVAVLAYLVPPLVYVLWRGESVMIPVRGDA
ncbi:LptF/LptG family permease [Shimia sediminis]|uniref:LptF/LptG family permease n=1 Tax=Shimia sediminis TaxID=2497945 RepID=UPI000F8CD0D3|nr:LptF/LptG family permease [Shimia sediminis]